MAQISIRLQITEPPQIPHLSTLWFILWGETVVSISHALNRKKLQRSGLK